LRERPQHEAVVRRHRMNGAALHDDPNHAPVEEKLFELGGLEVGDSRPEPDVRVPWFLGLETDEMFDHVVRRSCHPFEKMLACQRRPVQLADGDAHSCSCVRCRTSPRAVAKRIVSYRIIDQHTATMMARPTIASVWWTTGIRAASTIAVTKRW
jgi:hypothetical protein